MSFHGLFARRNKTQKKTANIPILSRARLPIPRRRLGGLELKRSEFSVMNAKCKSGVEVEWPALYLERVQKDRLERVKERPRRKSLNLNG
jgi:hypothetical protein